MKIRKFFQIIGAVFYWFICVMCALAIIAALVGGTGQWKPDIFLCYNAG